MKSSCIIRYLLIAVFALAASISAGAQLYVADQLFKDSVQLYNVKVTGTDTVMHDRAFLIPNGEALTYRGRTDHSHYALFDYNGRLFAASREDVRYSSDNGSEFTNVAQNNSQELRHTAFGRFFHTMTPFYLIAIIMVVTALLSRILARRNLPEGLERLFMMLVPVGLLAVALLEATTFVVCKHFLWWIEQDHLGFWMTLLLVLPVIVVILLQVNVGLDYKSAMEYECGEKLSWKPAFIGLVACIPVGVITALVLQFAIGSSKVVDIGLVIAVLGTLGIAFLLCLAKNARALGFFVGLAFTLFSFIYAVGVIIAVGLAIVVVFRLTLTALIWIIGGAMLLGGSANSSSGGSKGSYEYGGKKYSSESEASRARATDNMRKFAESKKKGGWL